MEWVQDEMNMRWSGFMMKGVGDGLGIVCSDHGMEMDWVQ